jgi:hypothetical protein
MTMLLPMTEIDGVPSKSSARQRRGMAHFCGGGPADKTCGDCRFRGYRRTPREKRFNGDAWVRQTYWYGGCAKFREMSPRHGGVVARIWSACKYFEQKTKGRRAA